MQKNIKDCTFDELVTILTWRAMEDLTKGEPLRSIMYNICLTVAKWKSEQTHK